MADEDVPDLDDLDDLVSERYVKSQFRKEKTNFMPEGQLRKIVTRKVIEKGLSEFIESDAELKKLVDFIWTRAIKIFIITVLISVEDEKLYNAMVMFKEADFSDEKLPVKQFDKEHEFSSFGGPWNRPKKIREFYEKQWTFMAPVIRAATSERQSNADFEHQRILPFTKRYDEGSDKGSFGQVFKYTIHPSHLDDPEEPVDQDLGRDLAVKELQPGSEDDRQKMIANWEREASVLQKMNALRQENIVRFITAFRRGEKFDEDYFLVFEWANGGNLRSLWKTLKRPSLTPELVKATVKQILGLATALHAAHYPESGPTFRHGDLKPENILWFRGGDKGGIGTLKIADWGLAKQHNIETELRSNKTSTEYGTRRYEPPEEHTGQGIGLPALNPNEAGSRQRKKRSRLYDVWAMGCITLEFIVWLLYGLEGLKEFNSQIKSEGSDRNPPFYQTKVEKGKRRAEVHPAVVEWMDNMAKLPACQPGVTALGGLLELVRTRLLVTELPVGLGTLESPGMRPVRTTSNHGSPSRTRSTQPRTSATGNSPVKPRGDSNPDIPEIVISDADADTRLGPVDSQGQAQQRPMTPPPSPPAAPSRLFNQAQGRARSAEFVDRMNEIYLDNEDDEYWLAGTDTPDPSPPTRSESTTAFSFPFKTNEYRTDDSSMDTEPQKGFISQNQRAQSKGLLISGSRQSGHLAAPTQQRIDYGNATLDSDWTISTDNNLAMDLFTMINTAHSSDLPGTTPSSNICGSCQYLQEHVWDAAFDMTYQMSQLKTNADGKICDLCGLFWKTCQRHELTTFKDALFKRVGSSLIINSTSSTSLSIFRDPNLKTRIDEGIQVGFGALPEPNSEAHFEVIRQWLACCDSNKNGKHSSCRQCDSPTANSFSLSAKKKLLPTRVLEVGKKGDDKVYLRETQASETGEWLALSYQWGPKPHFCTTVDNVDSHLQGMDFSTLPATFRDAVIVTRALGCRYLWIDSLCIIQGEGGDFNQEAKRMEQVYSGAYCVLAISRAASHYGGFLHSRRERGVVALSSSPIQEHQNRSSNRPMSPPSFYICESIDDFNAHVLESDLNRRGWVLQEHALARRTVFFTDHQTYFECGEGVRCETMMKMKNELANFLGDPNFPQIIMEANQGEKILRYQDLYKSYSRLALTNDYDRPMAINGLQDRLLGTLKTLGGFGVFDEGVKKKGLLRRSLLWHRAESETKAMKRIKFPPARHAISIVPSWSWMAYSGAIEYITPVFGSVEWENLESPWYSSMAQPQVSSTGALTVKNALQSAGTRSAINHQVLQTDSQRGIAIVGEAREYSPLHDTRHDSDKTVKAKVEEDELEMMLVFDAPPETSQSDPQKNTLCVVLGKQKGARDREQRRHYVILVRPQAVVNTERYTGLKLYDRVGAGYLPGRNIYWDRPALRVTIH